MIWESGPWKRDLLRRAHTLCRRRKQRRWVEASFASVEQDIFLSAYAIRKLLDAYKISDEVESASLVATAYEKRQSWPVDIQNAHKPNELYDLARDGVEVNLSLRQFCNQVIHSFIFFVEREEWGGLTGFYVASDREKESRVLHFDLDEVIETLTNIVEDDIVTMRVQREAVGQLAKVTMKSSRIQNRLW